MKEWVEICSRGFVFEKNDFKNQKINFSVFKEIFIETESY